MGLSTAVTKQANLMRELQTGYIYHSCSLHLFRYSVVLIGLFSFLRINSLLSLIDYRIICLLVATAVALSKSRYRRKIKTTFFIS